MKNLLSLTILSLLLIVTGFAQENENSIKPNYALAERFSPNKIARMVKQTKVQPTWFADGKRFIYSWKDTDGTMYRIIARSFTPIDDEMTLVLHHSPAFTQ